MENNINILDNILKKDISQMHNYADFFKFLKKVKNPEYFLKISIFDKEEYKDIKNEFENKLKNNSLSKLEKACIGSILGMAIGDAIGAKLEFLPLNYGAQVIDGMNNKYGGQFMLKPGQWTDDTSMGLCLADSLIEKKGHFDPNDIMMRFILWWFYGYNNAFRFDNERKNKHSIGLGGNISGSIEKYIKEKGIDKYTKYGNRNTSGNGSIMRNAAIPICYYLYEKSALELAKYQSLITHQGEEAAECCQLLTYIIIKILNTKIERCYPAVIDEINIDKDNNEKSLRNILDDLEGFQCNCASVKYLANSQIEQNEKKRNWNWKDKNFKYDEGRAKKQSTYIGSYCMDGLAMALHVLYHTNNFKDAILKAVNLCGDADSLGSIVGQIGGAYYEVDSFPPDWIQAINKWDHNEIALRGYILCNLNLKPIKNINIKDNNILIKDNIDKIESIDYININEGLFSREKNDLMDFANLNGDRKFKRYNNNDCCNIF